MLEELKRLPATTIVPGHGAVSGPGLIDDVLGYLRFVTGAAAAAREAGLSPLDAARQLDLGPYAGLLDAERIVGNLHRAYAELDGAPPGAHRRGGGAGRHGGLQRRPPTQLLRLTPRARARRCRESPR